MSSIANPSGRWKPFRSSSGERGSAVETFSSRGGAAARAQPGLDDAAMTRQRRVSLCMDLVPDEWSSCARRRVLPGCLPAKQGDRRPFRVAKPDRAVAFGAVLGGADGHVATGKPVAL